VLFEIFPDWQPGENQLRARSEEGDDDEQDHEDALARTTHELLLRLRKQVPTNRHACKNSRPSLGEDILRDGFGLFSRLLKSGAIRGEHVEPHPLRPSLWLRTNIIHATCPHQHPSHLVQALEALAQRADHQEAAQTLIHELSGITCSSPKNSPMTGWRMDCSKRFT
jgi:hypothetical protein